MTDSAVDQCLEGLLAAAPLGAGTGNSEDNQFRFDEDFYAQEDNSVPLGMSMNWAGDLPADETFCSDTDTANLDLRPVSGSSATSHGLDVDAVKPSTNSLCEGNACSADFAMSQPPALPTDPRFRLEPTTLLIRGVDACDLWRCLVLFFRTLAAATVTKVNPMKHSISADVQLDILECSLKVRTYAGKKGMFAVEVQRRRGNGLCFSRIFPHLVKHIADWSSPLPFLQDLNSRAARAAEVHEAWV
eukprot:CAMPEP_0172835964 /NCGR_PEP_ID=MMETSP1075-20121228/26151_1 /TAXON_ID=2916 /ORGANISM="Ceratium fusus, Strain PA161109" /LENGTH=244 /DNA_ID=CAMNT_0013679113 /DNA_START=27 /DNA_END=762 /DNA_ORIENTATION=-